jgi:predicted polyphosphate/ATP-dependent NAD kinase
VSNVGLIINPIAGLGGSVGLKGSDGQETQKQALLLGATPRAGHRAALAIEHLVRRAPDVGVITCNGQMGKLSVPPSNLVATIPTGDAATTTGLDTQTAARTLVDRGVSIIMFTGGDGTAQDILTAIGGQFPVIGIPAGVKVFSGVFSTHPRMAASSVATWLASSRQPVISTEVMDIDEEALRHGIVQAALCGHLSIPDVPGATQGTKSGSLPESTAIARHAIGIELLNRAEAWEWWLLGPGTTCAAAADILNVPYTLTGFDILRGNRVIANDVNELKILSTVPPDSHLVLSPIGRQGFLLGRGNQQITPGILRHIGGVTRITIVATRSKIASMEGRPLLVDTGDQAADESLAGYVRVICGQGEELVTRIAPAWQESDRV